MADIDASTDIQSVIYLRNVPGRLRRTTVSARSREFVPAWVARRWAGKFPITHQIWNLKVRVEVRILAESRSNYVML